MDLSAKGGKTIKKFQDNLWDLGLGEECLDQKHDPLKKKKKNSINWTLSKLKTFLFERPPVKTMRRQAPNLEKIFANHLM